MTAYLLNLFDLALTLHALQHGGVELNPLMRNPAVMAGYKVVVVGILCFILHHFAGAGNKVARWGLRVCTAMYGGLCIHHIYFILGGILL